MVCSGQQYTTEIIECQRCRCILDDGHYVCIAYEVSGTAEPIKTEMVALDIISREEKTLYKLHGMRCDANVSVTFQKVSRTTEVFKTQTVALDIIGKDETTLSQIYGTRCDANVSVTFQKDGGTLVKDLVDKKTGTKSNDKNIPIRPQTTRRPSRENQAFTYTSTQKENLKTIENHIGKENFRLQKGEICGKCFFENAFYATLISSVVIILCICLGLALYFFRKRLRYLRKKSQKILPRSMDANRALVEICTEHDNEYATIAEASAQPSTFSAIKPSSQSLESHYTEPLLPDVKDGFSESSRSLQLTREKTINDYSKFQSRGTHLLKDLNDGYVEPITVMKATKDKGSGACGIQLLNDSNGGASKSMVLQSDSTNEYFKLEESSRIQALQNSKGDVIKRERHLSSEPAQEYFQLQALSKIGIKGQNDFNVEGGECLSSETKIEQLNDQTYCEQVSQDLQVQPERKLSSTNEHFLLQATASLSTDTHGPNEGSLMNGEKKKVHEPSGTEASSEEKNDASDDETGYFILEKGSISKPAN